MDDDVASRQRLLDGSLDGVGGRVALADGRGGRDADHDVGELAAPSLPHPEPAQLNRRSNSRDRGARGGLGGRGNSIHQHVHVHPHQLRGGAEHEHGDEEGSNRIAVRVSRPHEQQASEHGKRAAEIAREMNSVRGERRAPISLRRAPRDSHPAHVDHDNERDHGERVPGCVHGRMRRSGETLDRPEADQHARSREKHRFRERGDVLGLPVPVLVGDVGPGGRRRRARRTSAARLRGRSPSGLPQRRDRGCAWRDPPRASTRRVQPQRRPRSAPPALRAHSSSRSPREQGLAGGVEQVRSRPPEERSARSCSRRSSLQPGGAAGTARDEPPPEK